MLTEAPGAGLMGYVPFRSLLGAIRQELPTGGLIAIGERVFCKPQHLFNYKNLLYKDYVLYKRSFKI